MALEKRFCLGSEATLVRRLLSLSLTISNKILPQQKDACNVEVRLFTVEADAAPFTSPSMTYIPHDEAQMVFIGQTARRPWHSSHSMEHWVLLPFRESWRVTPVD